MKTIVVNNINLIEKEDKIDILMHIGGREEYIIRTILSILLNKLIQSKSVV